MGFISHEIIYLPKNNNKAISNCACVIGDAESKYSKNDLIRDVVSFKIHLHVGKVNYSHLLVLH